MATIVRWDPMAHLERLQRELDQMFTRAGTTTGVGANRFGTWLPEADVEQTEDATVFKFDLPGMTADQVKVGVHDHLLTVSGERHEEHEEKHEGFLSRERAVGRFERSMRLPDNVKDEDIHASFKDGVLIVKVPRVAESKPRQIDITTS
jgi:HSP20 family protein